MEPLEDGTTELCWTRIFTATRPVGRKLIGKMTQEQIAGELRATHDKLVLYLQP